MATLLAQLAPQRSAQYGDLVSALAPHELKLSALANSIQQCTPVELARQHYLRLELAHPPSTQEIAELGTLATITALFEHVDQLDGRPGPWLRPIDTGFTPFLPADFPVARRYRGKTNEVLCHFMCNVARFAGDFAHLPWQELRVLDPLAGGGTMLFTALMLGAEAAGVEQDEQDVRSSVAYVRQFCQEAGIACRVQEERLRKIGRRTTLTVGKNPPRRLLLAEGKTDQSAAFVTGFKPHLVITDLPYGIQHNGPLIELLTGALPVWSNLLPKGGTLVYAWDATRFTRDEMITLVQASAPLTVLNDAPYNQLAHRVDRVIKRRDLLVARRE